MTLRAPFPWFGGKSRAAHLVWERFGDVPNYVEPFAGSLAVMLGRPTPARIETVNDLDAWIANFWRAVTADPEAVAAFANWPVNEVDLHARHRWLVNQTDFRERMRRDPDYFDAKIAGWWVWGICQWIGSGWCSAGELPDVPTGTELAHAGSKGKVRGVNSNPQRGARGGGVTGFDNTRPHLKNEGMGVHRPAEKRPVLAHGGNRGVVMGEPRGQNPMLRGDSGAAGAGIHASGKRPSLTAKGGVRHDRPGSVLNKMPRMDRGTASRMMPGEQLPAMKIAQTKTLDAIVLWMFELSERLRRVRVCCGDWKRVLGRSATECIGVTGIFLDPPYGTDAERDPSIYAHDDLTVAEDVRQWAVENGDNPKLRIALCGYQGEHEMPATWECVAWKANGGYAASAGNHENSRKERIWFSPHCLGANQMSLTSVKVSGIPPAASV